MRAGDGGKARGQRRDHLGRVIDRERGLRDIGKAGGIADAEPRHVLRRLDQQNLALGQLSHRADGLGVAGMADHHDLEPVLMVAFGLDMDLRDQRAGGIDIEHLPRGGRVRHGFRHAMSGKDHRPVGRAVVQLLDKDRAPGREVIDHVFVMHDLVAHIDRRAPFRERHFHDLDGAVHPGAEPARCREVEGEGGARWDAHMVDVLRLTGCAKPP